MIQENTIVNVTTGEVTKIPLTAEELQVLADRKVIWTAGQPMRDWIEEIKKTDARIPRWLENHIRDVHGGNAGSDDQVAYDAKVSLRATKP